MADPVFAVELGNLSMWIEKPIFSDKKRLPSMQRTMQIAKEANDFAAEMFKNHFLSKVDPMLPENMQLLPVMISIIAYDWISEEAGVSSDDYKMALFQHKMQDQPEFIDMMQKLQFTLMIMAARRNPIINAAMAGLGEAAGIIEATEKGENQSESQNASEFDS